MYPHSLSSVGGIDFVKKNCLLVNTPVEIVTRVPVSPVSECGHLRSSLACGKKSKLYQYKNQNPNYNESDTIEN